MADAMGGENFENDGEDRIKNGGEQMDTERVVEGGEDNKEIDTNGKVETRKYLPWKIIYQNIITLVTKQRKKQIFRRSRKK